MIRGDPFPVDPAWLRVYWQRAWISWKVTSSNLPQGWKFETKVLDKNLSLDTGRVGGWAAIIRDEVGCAYQGCGYGADTSANCVP